MASIATIRADSGALDADAWLALAIQLRAAWQSQGVEVRDATVLLPYANVLPEARAAFSMTGAWQPRIETIATLADALGPPPAWSAEQVTGDQRIDSLRAQVMLPSTTDRASLAGALASMANTLSLAQVSWPPNERTARWQALREELPSLPAGTPGAIERGLLRAAIAWAALQEQTSADRVWHHRFTALAVIEAGGTDPTAHALLSVVAATGAPVLLVHTDPAAHTAFDAVATLPPPQIVLCEDAAHEAREAAWVVIEALQSGHRPVALVAQDREVVRRIHAVLALRGWGVHDDTGWALSTTRAAARMMAVLRAIDRPSSRDAQLDAMKAMGWQGDDLGALDVLELAWRQDRSVAPSAAALLERWQKQCAGLTNVQRQPLQRWLQEFEAQFASLCSSLAADAAGRAVIQALWLDSADVSSIQPAHQGAGAHLLDWPGFVAWVEQALELAAYMPTPAVDPDVIITPLARTVLRPFGAVVFAGCDERFGACAPAVAPWPEAVAQAHGLPQEALRRDRERAAFVQLLRQPQVVLLRRLSQAGEPLSASRWIELAQSARRRLGQPPIAERVAAPRIKDVPRNPVLRPAPSVALPTAIPERWTASLAETLRACPYRFFSRGVLRLGEPVELDLDWQKRDHGDWLHKVLHRFHEERPAARTAAEDIAALGEAAHAEAEVATSRLDRDMADLLPFEAGFAGFAKHYVDWLQARDADGWRYEQGETARERTMPGLVPAAVLVGRIDRIDVHEQQGQHVIDYKTGGADELKKRAREPLEDTQLAAYAALMRADEHTPQQLTQASYLALDDRKAPIAIEHAQVALSAKTLMTQLPSEMRRLRQGAPMPALGEGRVCELCEARGLCRRDHWAPLS